MGLPSDYIISIFKLVLKTGSNKRYEELKNLYGKLEHGVDRRNVLHSLGSIADANLKKDTIRWALESVALQDFFYPIRSVHVSCPAGKQITWTYFKEELAAFKDKIGTASASLMTASISSCTGSFVLQKKQMKSRNSSKRILWREQR